MDSSVSERNDLVLQMMPRVNEIAWHLKTKLPVNVRHEDLVSNGVIGLIQAIDAYSPESGVKLSTFASYRIRGAMLDSLRDSDPASRACRRIARRISKATDKARSVLGRKPEDWEIASMMNLDVDEFCALRCQVRQAPRSVAIGAEAFRSHGRDEHRPDRAFEVMDRRDRINQAMSRLTPQQEKVLTMFFWMNMSAPDIAEALGISLGTVWYARQSAFTRLSDALRSER